MARKAGPGNGAEDAPEGRADLSPEEGGFVPDARIAEEPEAGVGLHPSEVGQDARIEALSEDGTAGLPEAADLSADEPRLSDVPEPSHQASVSAAVPEDWRQVAPSDDGGSSWTSTEAGASDATSTSPGMESAGRDPWSRDERGGSDPLVLTTSVDPAGDAGSSSAFTSASATSHPPAGSLPPLAPPPPRRRGGFGALLLGGMIAAALGFGAAWFAQDRLGLFPARLPADLEERLAALEARPVPDADNAQALADRLAEVETRLASLEEAPTDDVVPPAEAAPSVDLEPLREELSQAIEQAQARAGELEQRIAALETRPVAPTGGEAPLGAITPEAGPAVQAAPAPDLEGLRQDVLGALEPRLGETEAGLAEVRAVLSDAQASLDALEERLDQAEAQSEAAAEEAQTAVASLTEAQARAAAAEAQSAAAVEEAQTAAASLAEAQARAAAAETQARSRATLGEVEAAFATGQPFDALVSELAATGASVPDALSQAAAEGVPTLAELREGFPEAARAGLAVARDQGLLDDGSGVLGFLRGQLSVRSVAPREGGDADAVLSRAQAQLGEGHLDAALAEVDSLPEPVRDAMADWLAQARSRAQADAALAELRNALPAPDAPPAD